MAECKKWQDQGVNLMYENRANRNGYKAGALREGLQKQYASDCEYVVIFDADFQPEPNFLMKTVPYLVGNNKLGMVQARDGSLVRPMTYHALTYLLIYFIRLMKL